MGMYPFLARTGRWEEQAEMLEVKKLEALRMEREQH